MIQRKIHALKENLQQLSLEEITERIIDLEGKIEELQNYKNLLDNTAEFIWSVRLVDAGEVTDISQLKFKAINSAVVELFGFTIEEFQHKNIEDVLTAESYKAVRKKFFEEIGKDNEQEINPERRIYMELQQYHKNGKVLDIGVTMKFIRDNTGEILGIQGTTRDITPRKEADRLLQLRQIEFKQIYDNTQAFIYRMNKDGIIISCNEASMKILGMNSTEIIGRPFWEFVHRENKAKILAQASRQRENSIKEENYVFKLDIPCDAWINQTVTYFGENEQLAGFLAVGTEITELKQIEEKYHNILKNMKDGYFEVDIYGNFTWTNPAIPATLGYTQDSTIGMNYTQYMDKKNAEKVFKTFNKVFREKIAVEILDWELIRKDASRITVEATISPRMENDRVIGFYGVVRDITSRKENEEFFKQLALATFEGIIIHTKDQIIYNNERFLEIVGLNSKNPEEKILLIGKNGIALIVPEQRKQVLEFLNSNTQDKIETEFIHQREVDRRIPVELRSQKLKFRGKFARVIAIRDITERKEQERKLQELATHDALTGLMNLRAFDEKKEEAIYRARRNQKKLAFLMVDINNFKEINDRYSHLVGDKILKDVAYILNNAVRRFDMVFRHGGDEFIVILPEIDNGIERVIKEINSLIDLKNSNRTSTEPIVTLSIGGAVWQPDSLEEKKDNAEEDMGEEIRRIADKALYIAKENKIQNGQQVNSYVIRKVVVPKVD